MNFIPLVSAERQCDAAHPWSDHSPTGGESVHHLLQCVALLFLVVGERQIEEFPVSCGGEKVSQLGAVQGTRNVGVGMVDVSADEVVDEEVGAETPARRLLGHSHHRRLEHSVREELKGSFPLNFTHTSAFSKNAPTLSRRRHLFSHLYI